MSDSDPPPDSAPPESIPPPSPPQDSRDPKRRRRLEGVIPEIVRRAVELGVEKTLEAPDNVKQFVGDLKLPKEIAHYLLAQIDETKNGLFRVVAKEMRDFLEHTNFAGEMQKLLTTVQFEVNTTIRFTPNDGRSKKKEDRDKKKQRERERAKAAGEEPPPESSADALEDASNDDDDDAADSERVSLPKPEVKTAVHVHREGDRDSDRKRRRDRG